jgi:hypothetical protein
MYFGPSRLSLLNGLGMAPVDKFKLAGKTNIIKEKQKSRSIFENTDFLAQKYWI